MAQNQQLLDAGPFCDVQWDTGVSGQVVLLGADALGTMADQIGAPAWWDAAQPPADSGDYYRGRAAKFRLRPILPSDDDASDERLF